MEKIEKGMIVVLKSGGPNMTVSDVKDGNVQCIWFVGTAGEPAWFNTEAKVGTFPDCVLKEAK